MPLYLYALSLWYRVAPATLISGRLLSILGGLAVFALFYRFIRQFAGSRAVAALSVGLLGSCFQFIEDSTYVRMDSLSLLLNPASWLTYMDLRHVHFSAPIF